jgi:hypothetical protein
LAADQQLTDGATNVGDRSHLIGALVRIDAAAYLHKLLILLNSCFLIQVYAAQCNKACAAQYLRLDYSGLAGPGAATAGRYCDNHNGRNRPCV